MSRLQLSTWRTWWAGAGLTESQMFLELPFHSLFTSKTELWSGRYQLCHHWYSLTLTAGTMLWRQLLEHRTSSAFSWRCASVRSWSTTSPAGGRRSWTRFTSTFRTRPPATGWELCCVCINSSRIMNTRKLKREDLWRMQWTCCFHNCKCQSF